MCPPISKNSRSCAFLRRILLEQKKMMTPRIKNPARPEATETPITAPELRPLPLAGAAGGSLVVALGDVSGDVNVGSSVSVLEGSGVLSVVDTGV
jgi:hypothetical protein